MGTKRCLSIYLGSAQDIISERRTSSRAKFVMCLVATAWSECNVIPAGDFVSLSAWIKYYDRILQTHHARTQCQTQTQSICIDLSFVVHHNLQSSTFSLNNNNNLQVYSRTLLYDHPQNHIGVVV